MQIQNVIIPTVGCRKDKAVAPSEELMRKHLIIKLSNFFKKVSLETSN